MNASNKKLAVELAALSANPASLTGEPGTRALKAALASGDARLVAQAAKLAGEHARSDCDTALSAAYRALAGPKASADPGCSAKEAVVAALDALEHLDAELFAQAARHEQLERLKGGTRDTAGRVRARGVLGLARLGHHDLWPLLGAALADRDPTVRLAAARAIAHRGQREGAGLLLLRLGVGDAEAEVNLECVRGLFAIAPDLALREARALLRDGGEARREQVLHALGTAPDDGALELLAGELEELTLADERARVIEALGLSRRPLARRLLLELVQGERRSDAETALSALAIHRYDARLVAQLRELTAGSRELAAAFRELFEA